MEMSETNHSTFSHFALVFVSKSTLFSVVVSYAGDVGLWMSVIGQSVHYFSQE